mgnify:FL=1
MSRVVCINDKIVSEPGVIKLHVGNIYTVIDIFIAGSNDTSVCGTKLPVGAFYRLLETGHWYHHSNFIEINDNQQDETELIRERQKQLA